jgi:predicted nucleic acid-binding protein
VTFLLDTNVLSELRKRGRADRQLLDWFAGVDEDGIYLSVLVLGEIRRGIERVRLRDPRAAAVLDRWHHELVSDHGERILGVDREIAEAWGRLNVPDPLPVIDGLLAATAQVHGLTLVTRNVRDVARTGVPCLDPFAPSG